MRHTGSYGGVKLPLAVVAAFIVFAAAVLTWRESSRRDRLETESVDAKHDSNNPPALEIRSQEELFSPIIRVKLTAASVRSIPLEINGPYQLQPVGSTREIDRSQCLQRTTVSITRAGFRLGAKSYPVSRLEIVPEKSPGVWVNDHQYRGRIRLFRTPDGRMTIVNVLPLEDYIASVINGEMPASFPSSARQAQAIAARTYALYHMQRRPRDRNYDLHADTRSQKYLGYQYRDDSGRRFAGENAESRAIARRTAGMVCTWNGRLLCTYYSAVCGGHTQSGRSVFGASAPPLSGVGCDWCQAAERYRWTVSVNREEFESALKRELRRTGDSFGRLKSLRKIGRAPENRYQVDDGRRQYNLSTARLRRCIRATLPSSYFEVTLEDDELVLDGRGHGHGVGLCQWGARGQALEGKTASEIIGHYYPGAEIVVLRAN